jgi:hypothetical protein
MKKQLILSQHALTLIFEELRFINRRQKIREIGGGESRYEPKNGMRENLGQLFDGKRSKQLKKEI